MGRNGKLLASEIFVPAQAAIIARYLIMSDPSSASFSTGESSTPGGLRVTPQLCAPAVQAAEIFPTPLPPVDVSPFAVQKRSQYFIGAHNETLSVALRVSNPDRSPARIHG
jgi:hypothetical protein